ncbi:MAG: hypothetical protein ACLFPS_09365 [Clostridia bacterium]
MKNLRNIDRRIIYVILLIALGFPILNPIGAPFQVAKNTQIFYDRVDALEPGDVVVLSFDYAPTSKDELNPGALAVMRHILEQKKGVKLIMLGFWVSGPMFADINMEALQEAGIGTDWVYGEDYASLGYVAGAENAISSFAQDVTGTFRRDRRGNRSDELPVLEGVEDASDIDLIVDFGSGTPGTPEFIRQVVDPYKTEFITVMVSVSVAGAMPYYNSGQLVAYLNGLRGAGEYEALYGFAGAGTAAMDSYSFGHLAIILFVLIGNIAYYADPDRKKK